MDENDDDYEDEESEFFEPPKCNNTSDCADHANLFDVSSDQLVCGNGWRYGDENNNYCLVKCTNDEFCNEKGIELGWNEGTTCKRNYCVIAQAEDPCTELKAEEYAPTNGTFRINGDFIENPISKDEQVFVDGTFCSIKTQEEKDKAEEEKRLAEEELKIKEEQERLKQEEEERKLFEEEEEKRQEEQRQRHEEERKKKEEEKRRRQEQLELIRLENERLIIEEEERKRQVQIKLEEQRRLREEEEEMLRLEQEAKRKKEEEERKRKEDEARKRAEEERKRKEEEERQKKEEEELKKKEEEERKRKAEEERKRKEEEERIKKAEEERKRKEEEERQKKEEEERQKKEEEERKILEEIKKKKEAEERAKLIKESKKKVSTNKKIVKSADTIELEKCIKEGFINCQHKNLLFLINYYNENQTNDIIVDKCKISTSQKNYIYDKILINDDENLDGIELSTKKYNLMKTKFNDTQIICITDTLKKEIEDENKLLIEREKLLAKRKQSAQLSISTPLPNSAQVSDKGSGFNNFIIILLILGVVYLFLKFKKLI